MNFLIGSNRLPRVGWLALITLLLLLISCDKSSTTHRFGIVIHGGAGTITRENLSQEMELEYRMVLEQALNTGYAIIASGGSSVDAVEATLVVLEDSYLFNAGKGAVFNSAGKNELDASIMDGKSLQAGAVSGVRHLKNPIKAARMVMDESHHVLLYGGGAETFASEHDLEFVEADYFFTERRWQSLQKARQKAVDQSEKHGTVGAVALDRHGNLAAATSTGGLTNKRFGRIGDSPIIGAGNYANNNTCAVSATGTGEYFMRTVAAHNVSSAMEHGGYSLSEALSLVLNNQIGALGGTGGMIGIDKEGNIAMVFNTEGMYRGYYLNNEEPVVKIYAD